ncbi:response regulator [Aquincola sp. MAHUQ-54]|uniref:histidine kinase n=1 Tax=Aquincola agrisoli TaxID=3119538 RepID=A0AAW9QJJ5_9BURK
MNRPARVLLLEDSDIDTELICNHLQRAQMPIEVVRAARREEFEAALQRDDLDIVLADYSLPDFDGLQALLQARARLPDVPFVFVSGVVGEDIATDALRQGATDYVLKRNLARLPKAVERALAEARERARRRNAEAALGASEAATRLALERQRQAEVLFRLAAQAANIGVWEFDPAGARLWIDDGLRRIADIPPEAPMDHARFVGEIVHPDDRALFEQSLAAALAPDGRPELDFEHRVIAPGDQRVRWLAIDGRRFDGDDGGVRLVGTARDVTGQRRKGEALRRLNEALGERVEQRTRERDRIWNLSTDLMAVWRPDGTPEALNPAWESLLSWTGAELMDMPMIALVHPDDVDATRQAIDLLGSTVGTARFDSRVRTSEGSYRWIRWAVRPDAGFLYAVGRDVTEERAAVDELAAANRELKEQIAERGRVEDTLQQMQRLEAVGQLTSGVAHDFNNLLTVVLSNISLIRRLLAQAGPPDERVLKRLDSMQSAAERGAKLTAQMLAFSRRQRLEPQVIDLNDTVLALRDLLQSTLGGSVRLTVEPAEALWPALVDVTQMELIVLNLAINARDAMEVGGSITVRTGNVALGPPQRPEEPEAGDYVALTVSDTGSGMTPEVLAKAFEPFFTTKEVGKGSGLGLAQVYGFAKQSGGGVRIDTQPGVGTSVHVYMPRADGEVRPRDAEATVPGQLYGDTPSHTLLLVDDDPAVRDATASMLRDQGYRVIEAGSGGAALELIARRKDIELVLADFAMPGMNGAELVRLLKLSHPHLKTMFLTGFVDLGALKDIPEEHVLQKPLSEDMLARRLRKVLRARN